MQLFKKPNINSLKNPNLKDPSYEVLDLKNPNLKDLNSFRQCSKYISIIVGHIYFFKVNAQLINKYSKHIFRSFVHKYKLSINVSKINNVSQLLFFNTLNVQTMFFSNFKYLFEYLMPTTVKNLQIDNIKGIAKKRLTRCKLKLKTLLLNNYESNLPKKMLSTLKSFKICKFDSVLKQLPLSIFEELFVEYGFDVQINMFPPTLRKIKFGAYFNQPIELPEG